MTQRQISIATSFDYNIPFPEQLHLIAEAGFSHVSLGMRESHSHFLSKDGRRQIKDLLEKHNLQIDTIHGHSVDHNESGELLRATAEAALELAVPVIVFHGSPFSIKNEEYAYRLEKLLLTCRELENIARETGVIFALENVLPGVATDLIKEALGQLDARYFGFCYDSSHEQIKGPRPYDLLEDLKDRVVAVHLSDRAGEFVDHLIPGEGFIDWEQVAELVARSSFAGPLFLEVTLTHSAEKDPKCFLQRVYAEGCILYDKVFGK